MSDKLTVEQFPALSKGINWGVVTGGFIISNQLPPLHLISNVNVVPIINDAWVIIKLEDGTWEIPGGTLEPEETYLETIKRELLEEVGAEVLNFTPIGYWHCYSSAPKPYRPHLPHPKFYRLVGYSEVKIVVKPINPKDAEQVAEVELKSLSEVVKSFSSNGRAELGELYKLAALRLPAPKGIV